LLVTGTSRPVPGISAVKRMMPCFSGTTPVAIEVHICGDWIGTPDFSTPNEPRSTSRAMFGSSPAWIIGVRMFQLPASTPKNRRRGVSTGGSSLEHPASASSNDRRRALVNASATVRAAARRPRAALRGRLE